MSWGRLDLWAVWSHREKLIMRGMGDQAGIHQRLSVDGGPLFEADNVGYQSRGISKIEMVTGGKHQCLVWGWD